LKFWYGNMLFTQKRAHLVALKGIHHKISH